MAALCPPVLGNLSWKGCSPALHYSDHLAELQLCAAASHRARQQQPPASKRHHYPCWNAASQLAWPTLEIRRIRQKPSSREEEGLEHQPVSSQDSLPLRVLPRSFPFYFKERREASLVILVTGLWPPAALHPVREKGKTVLCCILPLLKLETKVLELGPGLEWDQEARTWGRCFVL